MDKGKLLKALRERKRLSQTEAARHIGVSKQTLYKYENNIITNIPYDIIERIATLYETSPAYIMGWDDNSYNERLAQYSPEQITRALDFLDAFQNASPDARLMVESLLKSHRHDP